MDCEGLPGDAERWKYRKEKCGTGKYGTANMALEIAGLQG